MYNSVPNKKDIAEKGLGIIVEENAYYLENLK